MADDSKRLYVVADGMGGHLGGGTASRMAIDTIRKTVRTAMLSSQVFPLNNVSTEVPAVLDLLRKAIQDSSESIFEASTNNPQLRGMGTTVSMVMFVGQRMYGAHVGDSRLYRMRQGSFVQVTEDHSLVSEQLKAGLISEEQARNSRFRNVITRSVGFEKNVQVDTFSLPVLAGDIFLLCSDGLTSMVSDQQIASSINHKQLGSAMEDLVETANRNGGEDNTTVLLLHYKGGLGRRAIRRAKRWPK